MFYGVDAFSTFFMHRSHKP